MTALQSILKEAKALKKAYPKRYTKWTDYVKQASAIYASKHKGKSPVGKKHAKKKAAKKVGTVHLAKSTNENIKLLENKIKQQKALLKTDKKNTYLKNVLKTNQNSLNFLKKGKKKVGAVKKSAKKKPTEKAVLKSIKHAVSVQKAHMSGVSHHAIDRIKSAMSHLSHYEMAVKKYMALPLKERKMYASNIKKLRHLVKETKTHISQLKKSI